MVNNYLINLVLLIMVIISFCSTNAEDKITSSYFGKVIEMTGDDTVPVKVWNASGKPVLDPYYAFEKKGLVLVGRDYSLRLDGGRFFSAGAEEYISGCLKNSLNAMTISLYINPQTIIQKGSGCIVGYGSLKGNLVFSLMQEKDNLIFNYGSNKSIKCNLLKLSNSKPFHFSVTVDQKNIIAYRNGKKVSMHANKSKALSSLKDGTLFYGNDPSNQFPWHGRIARFCLVNKALGAKDILKRANEILKEIKEIGDVPVIEFKGKLLKRSKYPMPWKEGFTYREVLTVCEYEVVKVIKGEYKRKKIRVAEWAYVDRIFLENIRKKIGSEQQLIVEEFNENPQLATLERADTLELDIDAITYYDLSPLVALPKSEYPKPPKKEKKK